MMIYTHEIWKIYFFMFIPTCFISVISIVLLVPSSEGQFSGTGKIIQSSNPCAKSFGDGWNRAYGCYYCFLNQYTSETSPDSYVWSSGPNPKLLKMKNTFKKCKTTSFPCNLNPWGAPRMIEFQHSFAEVSATSSRQELKALGCPLTGIGAMQDLAFIKGLNAIVKSDEQDCGPDVFCSKFTLYDLTRNRLVEIARLTKSDYNQCTPTGLCPSLKVIPSPLGNLLAVVILDDADLKARRSPSTDDSWQQYSSVHKVVFLETRPLLESGKMVVRGRPAGESVSFPPGQMFAITAKFRWSKNEDYFLIFDIDNGNKVAKFSVARNVAVSVESCAGGNPLCNCPFGAPTESSEYRYPDGLSATDLTTKQPTSAFNCGN